MKDFWVKAVNVILIVAILIGYNLIIKNREETEEIKKMQAQIEATNQQLQQYQEVFRQLEQSGKESTKKKTGNNEKEEKKEETQAAVYKDGVYDGSAKGYGGMIDVQVTIESDTITDIAIVAANGEDHAYLETASSIITDMLNQQSAKVDTVSGATFSSTGIREATAQALEKAKNTN